MDSAVWGLLGTVVGALSSIATTWLTALSMSKREQDKLREDRFERARAFQRQTLIELQDAIHDAMRLASRAFIEDDNAARAGKEWGRNMLSDDVDEGLRVAQRRVAILSDRVADDDLRASVKSLMQVNTQVALARSKGEAESAMAQATSGAPSVLEHIGILLRQNY